MSTLFGLIGMIINGLGVLGISSGVIAILSGNSVRGRELVLSGFVFLIVGIVIFSLGSMLARAKKGE